MPTRRGRYPLEEGREIDGIILEALPNTMFRVQLEGGPIITCHMASEMRRHVVHLIAGERVAVSISKFDSSRGRITSKRAK